MKIFFVAIFMFFAFTCKASCDSIPQSKYDSLKTKLFLANYALAKITFYVNICNKKPSQGVYLKGWVNRVVIAYHKESPIVIVPINKKKKK